MTQFCSFTLDGLFFGVSVSDVQEVIRAQPITRVPLAPHVVRGLINLRGEIVMALDLRRRLSLPERDPNCPPMNVVVRIGDEAVCLLVDDIGEVLHPSEASFELPPVTTNAAVRSFLKGVYKLERRLLLILNTQRVIEVTPTSPLDGEAPIER